MGALQHVLVVIVVYYLLIGALFAAVMTWAFVRRGERYEPAVWLGFVVCVTVIWGFVCFNAFLRYMETRRQAYLALEHVDTEA